MRSKVIMIGTLLLATALPGEVPANLFQSHREVILSGEITAVGEYTLGVGYAVPRATTPNAKHIAKERSNLLAQSNLLANIKLAKVTFPETLTPQECRFLLQLMRQNMSVSTTLEGLQTIHQSWDGTAWTSVVSIPTKKTTHFTPYAFEDILAYCRTIKTALPDALLEKLGIPLPPHETNATPDAKTERYVRVLQNDLQDTKQTEVRQEVQENEDGSIETFNEALYF